MNLKRVWTLSRRQFLNFISIESDESKWSCEKGPTHKNHPSTMIVVRRLLILSVLVLTVTLFVANLQHWPPISPEDSLRMPQQLLSVHRRRPPSSSDCLVFMHLPKTAGTSVRRLLKRAADDLGWQWFSWHRHNVPPVDGVVYHHHAIHIGHVTPAFLQQTSTEQCLRFTVLREPIDRVTSLFYFLQRTKGYHNNTLEACFDPFTNSNSQCQYWYQHQNEMVRQLSNDRYWDNQEVDYGRTRITGPAVADAQEFLADTDMVCFLDNLDACIQRMFGILGLPPPTLGAKNVNAQRSSPPDQVLDRMRAVNEYDVQLYEWALARFH